MLRKAVDCNVFGIAHENPISQHFFEATAQPGQSAKILFAGDTGRLKSLLTLLQAFAQLKEVGKADGWEITAVGPVLTGPY